jgi:hypothetical protein
MHHRTKGINDVPIPILGNMMSEYHSYDALVRNGNESYFGHATITLRNSVPCVHITNALDMGVWRGLFGVAELQKWYELRTEMPMGERLKEPITPEESLEILYAVRGWKRSRNSRSEELKRVDGHHKRHLERLQQSVVLPLEHSIIHEFKNAESLQTLIARCAEKHGCI